MDGRGELAVRIERVLYDANAPGREGESVAVIKAIAGLMADVAALREVVCGPSAEETVDRWIESVLKERINP